MPAGLQRREERVEPAMALVPERLVAGEPLRRVAQALPFQVAEPGSRPATARNEPCPLEHLEVLRDRRLRHRERGRKLGDRQVAGRQAGKDGAASRVGEGAEAYLKAEPTAGVLFRRVAEERLDERALQELLARVDQMSKQRRPKPRRGSEP